MLNLEQNNAEDVLNWENISFVRFTSNSLDPQVCKGLRLTVLDPYSLRQSKVLPGEGRCRCAFVGEPGNCEHIITKPYTVCGKCNLRMPPLNQEGFKHREIRSNVEYCTGEVKPSHIYRTSA